MRSYCEHGDSDGLDFGGVNQQGHESRIDILPGTLTLELLTVSEATMPEASVGERGACMWSLTQALDISGF